MPIYIGYDRVLEEKSYLQELEGGQKEPENLRGAIQASKFLKKRYGKIYIEFNEPILMNELMEKFGTPLADMKPKDQNALCRNLGYRGHQLHQPGCGCHGLRTGGLCDSKLLQRQVLIQSNDVDYRNIHQLFSYPGCQTC